LETGRTFHFTNVVRCGTFKSMRYVWDLNKEKQNVVKHKVTFQSAVEVLTSGFVIVLRDDNDHEEQRFVFLGMCKKLNILVVVVAYPDEEVTRIISARKANKKERSFYEKKL
jgi:uncharacterized DUF497 family protein